MFGARILTFFLILRAFTPTVSASRALARADRLRRRWLFPPLLRTSLPAPVRRNRLEVALWVLSFNLPPAFALRGTDAYSFQQRWTFVQFSRTKRIIPCHSGRQAALRPFPSSCRPFRAPARRASCGLPSWAGLRSR